MLCRTTVNLSGMPIDSLVDADEDDAVTAGHLRAHHLEPIRHQKMAAEDRPPVVAADALQPPAPPKASRGKG